MSTWILSNAPDVSVNINVQIMFTAGSLQCSEIWIGSNPIDSGNNIVYKLATGGYRMAWHGTDSIWTEESIRTITFTNTEPTGDLLTWLQANGTKELAYGGEIYAVELNSVTSNFEDLKSRPLVMTTTDARTSGTAVVMDSITGADLWSAFDNNRPIKILDTTYHQIYDCTGYYVSGANRVFHFVSSQSGTTYYFTMWISEDATSGIVNQPNTIVAVRTSSKLLSSLPLSGTNNVTVSTGYSMLCLVLSPSKNARRNTMIPINSLTTTAKYVQVADNTDYAVWTVSKSDSTVTFKFSRKGGSPTAGVIYQVQ